MKKQKTVYNYNCLSFPPEIFAAAGLKAYRPWPDEVDLQQGDLIPYDFCPYSRAYLSHILKVGSRPLLASCCDAMRRVYDIVKRSGFLAEFPRQTGKDRVDYFHYQLKKLLLWLDIDPEDDLFLEKLTEEMKRHEEYRFVLKEILSCIIEDKGRSFTYLFQGIVYYYEGRGDKLKLILKKMEDPDCNIACQGPEKPRVIITSSTLLEPGLINLIEETGFKIVGLDSCPGERNFNFNLLHKKNDNPLFSLARTYLFRPHCPRMLEPEQRLTDISKLLKSRRGDAIIYYQPKFCDQAAYDYKLIKNFADKLNIPVLQIESEYQNVENGQILTRVAAFNESLQIKKKRS